MPTRIARARLRPRKTPSQPRSTRMVEAIVEAAARILKTRGLAGFNTNAVAERAGAVTGLLRAHRRRIHVADLEEAAFDVVAMTRALIDGAAARGRIDPEALEERVTCTALGYLTGRANVAA